MLSLKSLSHILLATIQWMLFWGLVAAAFVAIVTTIQPDTGHVPRAEVPLMIGVPSAILGGIVGLIFACLMEASHQRNFLGRTVRVFVVGIMGTSAGII
ncbi:MAG TPA: hypothetical protein VGU90_06675, partial [Terriglobales bacterium]|nr:hypothetical protein [Terriglobales bacterium]